MSATRRILVVLGLLLLAASLCLLVVANLPNEHLQERQSLPVEDMTLPTPEASGSYVLVGRAPAYCGPCALEAERCPGLT